MDHRTEHLRVVHGCLLSSSPFTETCVGRRGQQVLCCSCKSMSSSVSMLLSASLPGCNPFLPVASPCSKPTEARDARQSTACAKLRLRARADGAARRTRAGGSRPAGARARRARPRGSGLLRGSLQRPSRATDDCMRSCTSLKTSLSSPEKTRGIFQLVEPGTHSKQPWYAAACLASCHTANTFAGKSHCLHVRQEKQTSVVWH